MKPKKNMLMRKANADKAEEQKQEKLRKQHNIEDENTTVIEKNTDLVKVAGGLYYWTKIIILIALAFVGSIALLYPAPRAELLVLYHEALDTLMLLIK